MLDSIPIVQSQTCVNQEQKAVALQEKQKTGFNQQQSLVCYLATGDRRAGSIRTTLTRLSNRQVNEATREALASCDFVQCFLNHVLTHAMPLQTINEG